MFITAFPVPTRSVVSVTTKTRSAAGSSDSGRVLANLQITPTDITVKGWPWNTKVFAQWDGNATLLNNETYINRGLHVFTLRWGKVYALEEFQDSQAAARGLDAQSAAGLEEAGGKPIVS